MRTSALALVLLSACSRRPASWVAPEPPSCGERVVGELVRWPYLGDVRQDGITVAWGADATVTGAVLRYGRNASVASSVTASVAIVPGDGADIALFHADVRGLEAGTGYCYAVEVDGVRVAEGVSFTTAPPLDAGTTTSFLVVGDWGSGTADQLAVRDALMPWLDEADLFVTTGDNAYPDGTWADWQARIFAPYAEVLLETPFYPTWGNHDYATEAAAPGLANVFLPRQALRDDHHERYWSLDHGPAHLVGLDSEGALLEAGDDDQIAWGTADLGGAAERPWRIALWHKPPFTGHVSRTGDFLALARLVPLVEEHGADLVLVGHDHFYERFGPMRGGAPAPTAEGGIPYVITGGGGRSLYDHAGHEGDAYAAEKHHFLFVQVDDEQVRVQAIGTDGVVFDELVLTRER